MSLLIKNVTVLTLDEHGTILPDTNIVIEGRTIRAIGVAPASLQRSVG